MEEKKEPFWAWPYYSNESIRKQIHDLLEMAASIECSLGKDSTALEKEVAEGQKHGIMIKIKELDVEFYKARIDPYSE